MDVIGLINNFLLGLMPVPQKNMHACNSCQEPIAEEYTDAMDKLTIILLSGHGIQLLSKFLSL